MSPSKKSTQESNIKTVLIDLLILNFILFEGPELSAPVPKGSVHEVRGEGNYLSFYMSIVFMKSNPVFVAVSYPLFVSIGSKTDILIVTYTI